jgi:mRNA interferase HigB
MRIIGRRILEEFCRRHPDTRRWIENWLADVGSAVWCSPTELKSSYATASFLAGNVVIFNVKGKAYRLETTVAYGVGVVSVSWAGTHAGYDARNRRRSRRR